MDQADPHTTYRYLLDLWTSGVRDYHSLLSDYLTANSIFCGGDWIAFGGL